MNSFQKVVLFFPFRWFSILAFLVCILFLVILTHLLVDKCNKHWSNEISDSEVVENQEEEEQQTLFDFHALVTYFFMISFTIAIKFLLQYHILSPRISLLLDDSKHILVCMINIPSFYFYNPFLRQYVWKKIMRISTVQPENNEIELQSIWTVLNKFHFIQSNLPFKSLIWNKKKSGLWELLLYLQCY